MWFVVVGVLFIVAHVAGIGPMANWNWEFTGDLWKFVLPHVLALVWWGWADASGLTKRREMDKDEVRKEARRRKNIEALGMGAQPDRKKPRR